MSHRMLTLWVVLTLFAGAGWAVTRNVPSPYVTIQSAINASISGDTIVVAPGTYHECINFSGKNITIRSTSPSDPSTVAATIIDGSWAGTVVTFESGETSSASLQGFTVTHGSASSGGGVNCDGASPLIAGNIIRANVAEWEGGGIKLESSSAIVRGNVIAANEASYGGGMIVGDCSPQISGNLIVNNTATEDGGGIEFYGADDPETDTLNLSGNTISGNNAPIGGGIYCVGDRLNMVNCIVTDQTSGGGIVASSDYALTATVRYCNVFDNNGGNYVNVPTQTGTNGNVSVDPCFVDVAANDFHLKSKGGHWTAGGWVLDAVTSPCVDAGDPASPFANEPAPNGGRVNMGFEGNTAYASRTLAPSAAPTTPTAVTIAPIAPGPEKLTATATGSTDANGDSLTYKYQWSKKIGATWSAWGCTGRTLAASNLSLGDIWRVRAQALDGTSGSPWKVGSSVKIVNMAGVIPAPKTYNVPVTTSVFASFRWPVQQATVTGRVQLKLNTKVIPTVMTWVTAEKKIKLRPKSPLLPNTYYRINIDPGITCTSGRVLGWGENYWFKTAPATTTAAVTVAAAPTAGGAELTVNLTSAATVRTVISNIAGRAVAELPERDLPAGMSSLLWNGKSNTGSKVPAGTYLVRVVATGSEGTQTAAVAPLQIR